jgi:hypothetical protein
MAFLDNSGDIILDAVLTDAGRARLARGDGSFKIVKYAFADDEIDYSKYDLNHLSGSAYFDINILTTPVLEALTNNTSTMKNRLLSIPKTNLFYLPIMQLNTIDNIGSTQSAGAGTVGSYLVSVDSVTDALFKGTSQKYAIQDKLSQFGVFLSNTEQSTFGKDISVIAVDQGLNTTAISPSFTIDPTLRETQYIVEIDNRLGTIANSQGEAQAYSFLDDDHIASYSFGTDASGIVSTLDSTSDSNLNGPRGTRISFRINPSLELNSSSYLFTLLGLTNQDLTINSKTSSDTSETFNRIDTNVRITGATTGYRISIPITFIKKYSA